MDYHRAGRAGLHELPRRVSVGPLLGHPDTEQPTIPRQSSGQLRGCPCGAWSVDAGLEGGEPADDQAVAAPDARDIRILRNHLEHKFVKIVDTKSGPYTPDILKDHLTYELDLQELHSKALRMLRAACSALVYLSLALHRSETLRERNEHVLSPEVATLQDEHKC